MVKSVYIHIPFCLSKCKYCSFISFENTQKRLGYLYSLLKEIDYYYKGELLDTLYFGGGTPSLYEIENLKKIINKFNISENTEITIEINPDSVDENYLIGLKEIGFNRLSIGSQSFDDNLLRQIGRRHDSHQVFEAIKFAKKSGFKNISVDLIYGLPNQTIEMFKKDLETVKTLDIQHVSLYGLKIEEGCHFYKNFPENLPNDDIQADMYILANELLQDEFTHYEISNWGKVKSNHNLSYWKTNEYYGFGISSHGYVDGVRYSNFSTLEQYLDNPTSREYGKFLTLKEQLQERIFLGFRIAEGINIREINQDFDIDFENKYKNILGKYIDSGHLLCTKDGYRLSIEGFLLSNLILCEFIEE